MVAISPPGVFGEFITTKIAVEPEEAALRILCACPDTDRVRDAVAHAFRLASVETVEASSLRRLCVADGLVVDAADNALAARATGFDGGIVIVAEPATSDELASFSMQGTHFAAPLGGAEGLIDALRTAIPVDGSGRSIPVDPGVARTRRLLAAGELALALRHAFNNPLTALMAEIQMLQMEARDDDTQAAATRMIDLVRRLTEVSRSLESVRDR